MSASQIPEYAWYGVVFLTMISVLVAAHELGHYLFARLFGMGVEEFSIGFGKKPLFTYMTRQYKVPIFAGQMESSGSAAHGADVASLSALEGAKSGRKIERIQTAEGDFLHETTEFTVRPWPLGGFVRIKGMVPEEDGTEVKVAGGFYSKPPWQRFIVLFAGPLFSVIAGILVIIPVLMFDGKEVPSNKPTLGAVIKSSAADKGGLQEGDQILAINGAPVHSFYDMVVIVRKSDGKPLAFKLNRPLKSGGIQPMTLKVLPKLDDHETPLLGPDLTITKQLARTYKIGTVPSTEVVHLTPSAAISEAGSLPLIAIDNVIQIFAKPKNFGDNVAGPVTMVQATARAVQLGIWKVLDLAGLLSISVGIFNLLPAHPLDGGQMMMAVTEMLMGGRRLSIRAQLIAGGIGMTFVFALVLGALFVDFTRNAPKGKDTPAFRNSSNR
jgi:regulator of sigma E protease